MAKRRAPAAPGKELNIEIPAPNPKQWEFYRATSRYVCYGGAKGGGKSHAVRTKGFGGALDYPGIRILMMREHYPELEQNLIAPMLKMVPAELASYNSTTHTMSFWNGSYIKFGHWNGEQSESEYNGLEFDWIFIDEATQFTERAFRFLGGCLRGVNEIPKRMYLTCNPGGVGHRWVKRLFIDRNYKTDSENEEENENPEDYTFIFATVDDNTALMNSPGGAGYKQFLANLPENIRNAYRYGDWNVLGGNYFPEFSEAVHVCKRFQLPKHWQLYRAFDYGLDKFCCYWFAVDEDGRSWCYREVTGKDLIVQDAAEKLLDASPKNERYMTTYAPPDMWSRQKDTGKTMAAKFMECGVALARSDNNRVQGHMAMKSMLAPGMVHDPYVRKMFPGKDTLPMLMFFPDCKDIVSDIQDIQADEKNPNDCAKNPHEVTHSVDGVRYYCVMRTMPAEAVFEVDQDDFEEEEEDYESFMCGGEPSADYMGF